MAFLTQQNRRVGGEPLKDDEPISAKGKHVIVIGGGDTGSDCVGTANRQGAASVTQFELLPRPAEESNKLLVWPDWPTRLRTSSSHQEGCERRWSVATKSFTGQRRHGAKPPGRRGGVDPGQRLMADARGRGHRVRTDGRPGAAGDGLRVPGARRPARVRLASSVDARGNVAADTENYRTSVPGVFTAGDMRRGQSLVVWAIREGRQCARAVDEALMGRSDLPR